MEMSVPLKEIRDRLAGDVAWCEELCSSVDGSELQEACLAKHQAALARLRAFDQLCQGARLEKVVG